MTIIRYLLNRRGNFVGPEDFSLAHQHTNLHAKIQTSSFKIGRVRASERAIKASPSSDFQRSTFNLFPNPKRLKLAIATLETTLRKLLPTFFGPVFSPVFPHIPVFKIFSKNGRQKPMGFLWSAIKTGPWIHFETEKLSKLSDRPKPARLGRWI